MFHLSLQKDRNIPTLYEKVNDFLGHPVYNFCFSQGFLCVIGCVFCPICFMLSILAISG